MKSNIFPANFTDAFGVQHPAAQCMLTTLSLSNSAYFGSDGDATASNGSCSYQVMYWHSQAAKDKGALPQEFIDSGRNSTFYVTDVADVAALGMADAMEKCQQHFLKEVAPKMIEAEQQG